jgi:serine/threonine protein kinase
MPLAAGTRLGPYEILSPLGAGGMGEVYRARDTRLDRTVAIKISAEKFSERFEREARAISSLNHPHICTLYDVGLDYLVMEYIDGHSLAGPVPLEQALRYAIQIADTLDTAHRKGIVHRDLKPANSLVSKQGIKLLDFGLTKMTEPVAMETVTAALTSQGAILGTQAPAAAFDVAPLSISQFPFRGFSLNPDGESFLTSIYRMKSQLYLMEGFDRPVRLLDRLFVF